MHFAMHSAMQLPVCVCDAPCQAGWLYLLPSENRCLPSLRGEISLADAIVSTPLARKASAADGRITIQSGGGLGPSWQEGGREGGGDAPQAGAEVAKPRRIFELAAADNESAAEWVAAIAQAPHA